MRATAISAVSASAVHESDEVIGLGRMETWQAWRAWAPSAWAADDRVLRDRARYDLGHRAVVASFVELSPAVGLGAVGVPVNAGIRKPARTFQGLDLRLLVQGEMQGFSS